VDLPERIQVQSHPSKFKPLMDEHYNFDDACEYNVHNSKDLTKLMQNGSGVQLEKWTDARNTKSRSSKQLRNFLKVNAIK